MWGYNFLLHKQKCLQVVDFVEEVLSWLYKWEIPGQLKLD